MTKEQLHQREAALKDAGYHKSHNTSSTNDYSWFKAIHPTEDSEDWLYMIEWRVWNWVQYIAHDPTLANRPYSMELCVLVNMSDGNVVRLAYPDEMSIKQAEDFAKDLHHFIITHPTQLKEDNYSNF